MSKAEDALNDSLGVGERKVLRTFFVRCKSCNAGHIAYLIGTTTGTKDLFENLGISLEITDRDARKSVGLEGKSTR